MWGLRQSRRRKDGSRATTAPTVRRSIFRKPFLAPLRIRRCSSVWPGDAVLDAVKSMDAFAQSFDGVALVTNMYSLTSLGYTAKQ